MMLHTTTFQTLADPTRLQILEILRGGEQAVNDIVSGVAIDQSGVSRHLRILHDAGFVQMRPEGQRRVYALRAEPFQELDEWISRYREMWERRLDRFGEALLQSQMRGANRSKKASSNKKGREKSR
jgi:DNA-binding transcriptional ArsR family regulator